MLAAVRMTVSLLKLRIGIAIAASALAGIAVASGPSPSWLQSLGLALAVLGASGAAGAFNHYYERDLDRLAISIFREASSSRVVAIADGRFDRKKIEAYGAKFGALKSSSGKTIYAVPVGGPSRTAFFSFLRNDRVAWSNNASYFAEPRAAVSSADWREHFLRLAGTPVFAVLHEDSDALGDFAQHAPGGLRSPQLASLLSQLQWISIGGKPEGNLLRVVIDGEPRRRPEGFCGGCSSQGTAL